MRSRQHLRAMRHDAPRRLLPAGHVHQWCLLAQRSAHGAAGPRCGPDGHVRLVLHACSPACALDGRHVWFMTSLREGHMCVSRQALRMQVFASAQTKAAPSTASAAASSPASVACAGHPAVRPPPVALDQYLPRTYECDCGAKRCACLHMHVGRIYMVETAPLRSAAAERACASSLRTVPVQMRVCLYLAPPVTTMAARGASTGPS